MSDVPILHPYIRVQAVGFRDWQGQALGILVTPWFMNLMLVPLEDEEPAGAPGESFSINLPAGSFSFINGEEASFGHYAMCSLSSPMFDYADHDTAVATAESALEELFRIEEEETPPAPPVARMSRRSLFTGLAETAES